MSAGGGLGLHNIRFIFTNRDPERLRPGTEPVVAFRLQHVAKVLRLQGHACSEKDISTVLKESGAHYPSTGDVQMKVTFAGRSSLTPGVNGPDFVDGQRLTEAEYPWSLMTARSDAWVIKRSFWDKCIAESADKIVYASIDEIRLKEIDTDRGRVNAYDLFTDTSWRGFHTTSTPSTGYDFDDPLMAPRKFKDTYDVSAWKGKRTSRATLDGLAVAQDDFVDLSNLNDNAVSDLLSELVSDYSPSQDGSITIDDFE